MKLLCCEVCSIVGVVSIALETGFSVDRINKYLTGRGVKSSGNNGYNKQAFNNIDSITGSED